MVDKNDIQEPSCSRRRSVESNLLLDDYEEVAPEYRAIFERLLNKDESLKIQALHKISELVKNDDSKNAKAVLSYWADFYYTLTTDIDHNVREAAQACHGVLVRASGGLSKALQKWLLCDWLVVCCDSHAPTAELARAQLQSTFPGSKLGKAISTCKEEIVKLLFCNLTGSYNIVSRLSESEINNPKDLHSKIKRLILNTLKAVVFLITLIPETETVWWWGQLKELLQSLKIWKFYVDKPKPHREECPRFYVYPHFIWAREKTCRKKINKIVSYIKDIFNTITEKPSLEVYARRCDYLDGNIVCPFKNDNNIIANIANESNMEQQELTKKDLMLFLHNLIFRAVVLREALFKSNVVTYIVVRDEFVMKELNKILHDAAVLTVLSQKYGFWPDYKIIVEGLQLIDVVITNILCMLSAVAKEALSVYFAKNAAARGYYWSYASRLYEEKKKNLKYITPHVARNSSYCENSDSSLDKEFTDAERVISSMETSSLENFIMGIGYMHNLQASHRAAPGTLQLVMLYSVLAAHAERPALCAELHRGWRAGLPPADVIINVYRQHEELMLFSTDLSIAPWSVVVSNAAIVDFLDGEVKKFGWQLLSHQWDFIFETLMLLISSLQLSAYRWDCYKVAIIARALLTLLGSVYKFVVSPEAQSKPVEWAYTLAPHLTRDLVEFITFVLDREGGPMTSCHISTINALIDSFEPLQHFSKLPAHMLRPLCKRVGATMRRRTHPTRKLFAFAVLEFVADLIMFEDAKKLGKWCHDNEFEIPMSEFYFNCLDEDVKHLQDVVNAALPDIESPESTHQLVPGSEVHSAALGFLLLSTHMLRQCARASADQSLSNVAKLYPSLLRGGEFPHRFMLSSVQILLDDEMRDFVRCIRPHDSYSDFRTGLEPLQQVNVYSPFDAYSLGELARFVLCETLSGETAYDALQWTLKLSSSASAVVQEVVGKVASPVLQHRLLCDLTQRKHELSDVNVRVQWWNTSVRCKLQVEDDTLELTLQLAKEHPLKQPTFMTSLSPAPDTCLIAVDLLTKNGTLLNALQTWIGQVIDCVRGATPCYICFDRVHASSGRLPAAPCPQCRNKFHNVCLNQWFRTSGRAKCPLCRSRFRTVPYQEHNTD